MTNKQTVCVYGGGAATSHHCHNKCQQWDFEDIPPLFYRPILFSFQCE